MFQWHLQTSIIAIISLFLISCFAFHYYFRPRITIAEGLVATRLYQTKHSCFVLSIYPRDFCSCYWICCFELNWGARGFVVNVEIDFSQSTHSLINSPSVCSGSSSTLKSSGKIFSLSFTILVSQPFSKKSLHYSYFLFPSNCIQFSFC